MNQNLWTNLKKILQDRQVYRRWKAFVSCLAVIVVLGTMYALILPAKTETVDSETCSIEEHTHSVEAGCYEETTEWSCTEDEGDEHTHVEGECYTVTSTLTCDQEEHSHSDDVVETEKNKVAARRNRSATIAGNFTSITGKVNKEQTVGDKNYEAVYDNNKGEIGVEYRVDFTITGNDLADSENKIYTYDLDAVTVPETLLDTWYNAKDESGTIGTAFQYMFEKNDEGRITLQVKFANDYTVSGDTFNGHIEFFGYVGESATYDNNGITIPIGTDGSITISSEKIYYPSDSTKHYDIYTKKSQGVYNKKDKTLTYTVAITSEKGTAGTISVSDSMTITGATVKKIEIEKVQNLPVTYYSHWAAVDTSKAGNVINGVVSGMVFDTGVTPVELNYNLTGLNANSGYLVTYVYYLENLPEGNISISADNGVEVISDNGKGEKVTSNSSTSTSISKDMISKAGDVNSETGDITWTITVNNPGSNIADQVLTDEMFSKVSYDAITVTLQGTLDEQENVGYTINKNDDGTVASIKFNTIGDTETNNNTYIITYTTHTDKTSEDQYITNKADFNGKTVEKTVKVSAEDTGGLKKTLVSTSDNEDGTFILNWKLEITVPDSGIKCASDWSSYITDLVKTDSDNGTNKDIHWITGAQIENLLEELYELGISTSDLAVNTIDGGSYNRYDTTADKNTKYTGFIIYFIGTQNLLQDKKNSVVTVSYSTTGSKKDLLNSQDYYNNASYSSLNWQDQDYYRYEPLVTKLNNDNGTVSTDNDKKIVVSDVNSFNKELSWMVRIYVDKDYKSMTVTDNLPENVKIKAVGIDFDYPYKAQNNKVSISGTGGNIATGIQVNVSSSGEDTGNQIITTTIYNSEYLSEGKVFYIYYLCETNDDLTTDYNFNYTNNANVSVSSDGNTQTEYGSDSRSVSVVVSKVTKTVKASEDGHKLHYTVQINPNGLRINGGEDIDIVDTLTYKVDAATGLNVSLDRKSVTLKALKKDGTIEKTYSTDEWGFHIDEEPASSGECKNTIKATVPDETSLVLEYDYLVEYESIKGSDGDQYPSITNKFELSTIDDEKSTVTSQKKWKNSGTSGGGSSKGHSYTFYKTDAKSDLIALQGAVFAAYKYNANGEDEQVRYNDSYLTYKTDGDGSFSVSQLTDSDGNNLYEAGKLYYVKETAAPSGYDLPSNPEKYYFYFSDTDIAVPDGISAVNLTNKAGKATVKNSRSTDSWIRVEKVWKDYSGSVLSTVDVNNITVGLYRKVADSVSLVSTDDEFNETDWESVGTLTLSSENDWKGSFTKLPASDTNTDGTSIKYTYCVKETAVTGYADTYIVTSSNYDEISDLFTGDVTITNTSTTSASYELPETGGTGRWPYAAGGMLLAISAGILLYRKKLFVK